MLSRGAFTESDTHNKWEDWKTITGYDFIVEPNKINDAFSVRLNVPIRILWRLIGTLCWLLGLGALICFIIIAFIWI